MHMLRLKEQNQEQINHIDMCEKKKLGGPLLPLTFPPFFL